jgi:4'-phosphopantetheinyl transferase
MKAIHWSKLLREPNFDLKLKADQIHLWQASVLVPSGILPALDDVLSDDERTLARRFRFQRDHNSYVVSRGLLRYLLAMYSGEQPSRVKFRYGAQGKPELAGSTSALRFNISHSGDMVLLGFAGQPIGVDIELMQEGLDFAGLAKSSFSDREEKLVNALPAEKRAALFYEYWSCKEACIKADGRGLSAPLKKFSISSSNLGAEWRGVALEFPEVFESSWRIRVLDSIPGYAAAVASAGEGWNLTRMRMQEFDPGA